MNCLLLVPSHLPADDFLEPEEYAEPDGAKPEDAADLGRSRSGLLARSSRVILKDEGRGMWPTLPTAPLFPEAEAMPASLSYEELVRRNVVGPGWRGVELGNGSDRGSSFRPPLGALHHHISEVRPGDGAEPACQGLGG